MAGGRQNQAATMADERPKSSTMAEQQKPELIEAEQKDRELSFVEGDDRLSTRAREQLRESITVEEENRRESIAAADESIRESNPTAEGSTRPQPSITRGHSRRITIADGKQVNWDENQPEVFHNYPSTPVVHDPHNHLYPVKPEHLVGYRYYDDVRKPPRTILDIPVRTFWFLVVVLFIIIAATLGGSIGGAMAVKNSNGSSSDKSKSGSNPTASTAPATSSSSSVPTATTGVPVTYTPIPFSDLRFIDISCPATSNVGSLQGTAILQNKYTYTCDASYVIDGNDIIGFQVYTLQSCIDACSAYNESLQKIVCKAVSISANVALEYHSGTATNCWLKNSTDGMDDYFTKTTLRLMQNSTS